MNSDALVIGAAAIAALGPTLVGLASWRQASQNGRQMKTNHGKRPGEYLELIAMDVRDARRQLAEHTAQDDANFRELSQRLDLQDYVAKDAADKALHVAEAVAVNTEKLNNL